MHIGLILRDEELRAGKRPPLSRTGKIDVKWAFTNPPRVRLTLANAGWWNRAVECWHCPGWSPGSLEGHASSHLPRCTRLQFPGEVNGTDHSTIGSSNNVGTSKKHPAALPSQKARGVPGQECIFESQMSILEKAGEFPSCIYCQCRKGLSIHLAHTVWFSFFSKYVQELKLQCWFSLKIFPPTPGEPEQILLVCYRLNRWIDLSDGLKK